MPHIRIFIVDDHQVVAVGLKYILELNPNLLVIGTATSLHEARTNITDELNIDVILLDVRLPDGLGYTLCQDLLKLKTKPKVLVLTSAMDDKTIAECIRAGVNGYILKDAVGTQLTEAILKVYNGESVLDPHIVGNVMSNLRTSKETYEVEHRISLLSEQERNIILKVSDGKTNKEIAIEMGLSEQTIKNYLNHAMGFVQLGKSLSKVEH